MELHLRRPMKEAQKVLRAHVTTQPAKTQWMFSLQDMVDGACMNRRMVQELEA